MTATMNNAPLKGCMLTRAPTLHGGWRVAATVLGLALPMSAQLAQADTLSSLYPDEIELGRIVQQQAEAAFILPDRNLAFVNQSGNENSARIRQQGNGDVGPNLAAIYQMGNGNNANIDQEGVFNIGLVSQKGDQLSTTLEQNGYEFEAAINQVGINGNVQVSQSGSGYRAITVDQLSRSGVGATATIITR